MANERWNHDIAYAMTPFKLITWPIGVWPLQVYNVYSLIRWIFGICCTSLMVILPSIELYMGCTDAGQNVDYFMLIFSGTIGMTKITLFRIYANNLIDNYESALNDYLNIENVKQRAIMRRHAFIGRTICCLMMSVSYLYCMIYALIPLLGDDENISINITNENSVPENTILARCSLEYFNLPNSIYKIFCFIEVIALILATTANMGNDAMFLNITLHMCGQVKILKTNFMDIDVTNSKVCDRFNILIQRHIYLIYIAKKLVKTVSFILLTQLFMSSILLCIIGFQLILSLKVNDMAMAVKSSMALSVFLSQLMLYSIIGDYLKSQMEEVGLSIYQSSWYDFPTKLTRNMIFVLMRTESPVAFQAGNFIMINLSTYMSILKTSASYLSVLRVIIEI